jgi:hypothetical protein
VNVIDPEGQLLNPFKISRKIYLYMAECVNAIDDLPEIESDATEAEPLEGGRPGARISLFSSRFEYTILCEHQLCSLQLMLTGLDGGRPLIILSTDCRYQENWLRLQSYVLVCENYQTDDTNNIRRILMNAYGRDLWSDPND